MPKNKTGHPFGCKCRFCKGGRTRVYTVEEAKDRKKNRIRKIQLAKIGWTPEQYEATKQAQGNTCAVCKKPEMRQRLQGRLAADHSHKNGKRRGLLCCNCNVGLGLFDDNPSLLELAAEYLRRFE